MLTDGRQKGETKMREPYYVNQWIYNSEKDIWYRSDMKMHVLSGRIDMSDPKVAEEVENGILAAMTIEESEKRTRKLLGVRGTAKTGESGIYSGLVNDVNTKIRSKTERWHLVKGTETKQMLSPMQQKEPERKKKSKNVSKEIREQIIERDHHVCRYCGSRERLQVHHIKYRSKGGSEEADNLITLCEWCHYEIHKDEPVGNIMYKHLTETL